MGQLDGKKAVVTAAAQGIGLAIAQLFLSEGAFVWAVDLNEKALTQQFQNEPCTKILAMDATNEEMVSMLAYRVGTPDIVVSAVGWVPEGDVMHATVAEFNKAVQINMLPGFLLTQAFLPKMVEKGGGAFVHIGSMASHIKAFPNRYLYAATKAAVSAMSKSVARDFSSQHIRSITICPGTIDTPSLADRIARGAQAEGKSEAEIRQRYIDRQPVGRLGTPWEIAKAVLFVGTVEYITGIDLVIDGGCCM